MEIKRINETISVSPQVGAEDMDAIRAEGFTTVINNRPDGEAPDQPEAATIEAAARAAGLAYHHIPLGREGVNEDLVQRTREAIETSEGKVLAFCRSGTRSTTLWVLSQAGTRPARDIIEEAAHAGYDMSHLAAHLDRA